MDARLFLPSSPVRLLVIVVSFHVMLVLLPGWDFFVIGLFRYFLLFVRYTNDAQLIIEQSEPEKTGPKSASISCFCVCVRVCVLLSGVF